MKRIKGMTLVEVIISLALLGILSIVFINAFTMSFTQIIRSGHRTDAVGKAQAFFYSSPAIVSTDSIQITLQLPGATTKEVSVVGSYAMGTVILNSGTSNEVKVDVLTFVPGMSLD